jgi:hypothetical protein
MVNDGGCVCVTRQSFLARLLVHQPMVQLLHERRMGT